MTYTIAISNKNKKGKQTSIDYVYVNSIKEIKTYIKKHEASYNNLTRVSIYDYYRDRFPNFCQTNEPSRIFLLNSKREWRSIK